MAKQKSLGRGLGELLGEIEEAYDNEVPKSQHVIEVPLNAIRPNPFQPRKRFDEKALHELAASIKQHGLIQPIVLVEDVDGYILVAGERRWRATRIAKLKTIRAVIVAIDEAQMRQHALIENIQREQLNIIELASAYEELLKVHSVTQDALASVVHKSRTHITNTLRLLQLSKKTRAALINEKITAGHAKVLVGLSDKEQTVMVDSIVGQKLNVRDTEQMVKLLKSPPARTEKPPRPAPTESPDVSVLAKTLQSNGFNVTQGQGKVTIAFTNVQDVERFLRTIE